MRQSVRQQVLARIYGHGRGWCFFQGDFLDISHRNAIDKALSTLTAENVVRRIAHGLYLYPEYSEFLQQELGPDIDQAAQAIARKHGWRIQPIGAIAANLIGVSEQVPAKVVYHSDGLSRTMKVGNRTIRFKHAEPKILNIKNTKSALIVHALKYMGKQHIDRRVTARIQSQLSEPDKKKLLRDARYATDWVLEAVKRICQAY